MLPIQSAAYCPEELSLLGDVLDSAVASLPPPLRTASNRMAIARNILSLAATGVRDPLELQLAATMNLKITAASNTRSSPSPMRRSHNRPGTATQLPPFRQNRMSSSVNQ
jgi:hypothetical protein